MLRWVGPVGRLCTVATTAASTTPGLELFAQFGSLVVAQFAVTIFVEAFEHFRPHLFAIGAPFACATASAARAAISLSAATASFESFASRGAFFVAEPAVLILVEAFQHSFAHLLPTWTAAAATSALWRVSRRLVRRLGFRSVLR